MKTIALRAAEELAHLHQPDFIILYGSIKQQPPLPILMLSSLVACLLALIFQSIEVDDVVQTLYKGFDISMVNASVGNSEGSLIVLPEIINTLFNRGGLYALNEPIIITILVFIYVGALDCIAAMPTLVNQLLKGIKRKSSLICTTLFSSAMTNAMTSSQYANS